MMKFRVLLLLCLTLTIAGCSKDEVEPATDMQTIDFTISIPAEGSRLRRVVGDPGTTEQLMLPQYGYFYIIIEDPAGKQKIISRVEELQAGEWQSGNYSGQYATAGDPVYTYKTTLKELLKGYYKCVMVYAAVSREPLTLSNLNPTTEQEIQNLTFSVTDAMQDELQNLYSTPYNYEYDGHYYALFERSEGQNMMNIHLLLYHVAAKVDLKWNIVDSQRDDMRLSYMQARSLFNGDAYLFKPTHNTLTAVPDDGYTRQIISSDIGLQWEGRSYFYTIPYTVNNKFPLRLQLKQNDENDIYTITLNKDFTTADEVFVPWLRGDLNFTGTLQNKTIDID